MARGLLIAPRMTIRVRRSLRLLVFAIIGVALAYVVLTNAFLTLGGVQWMCRSTNSIAVNFDSAWTVWPGVVHARNLEVTIQDRNVESLIHLDRATLTVRMTELVRRTFHSTRLRGEGLSFRFRHRVMPESAKLLAVRALPPIRGFEDPPVFEAGPPEPPIPDDKYNLWTIELDDVDVAAREVWVEQFRYLGRARAAGTFRIKPARSVRVGPASLTFDSGRVASGGGTALTKLSGRIECTVTPFDVRVPHGL